MISFIDRSPALAGLNYAKGQILHRLRLRDHYSGSTARSMPVEDALRYVSAVVADYLEYGAAGDASRIQGKDILEVGPGDNLGVALLLLAKGARSVTCIDGYAPASNAEQNSRLYAAIYDSFTEHERALVQDSLARGADGRLTAGGERLIVRYGVRIDLREVPLETKRYDIIVSRAVLEHLGDLSAGWRTMVRCLRPAGEMWHIVDLQCHNLFGEVHPLYFLTIRETLWNLISRPDPTLNRARASAYRELADRDFRTWRMYFTHVVGGHKISPFVENLVQGDHYLPGHVESVQNIRPQLAEQFRSCTVDDLLVAGAFLVARDLRS